jgi:teichuronic acid biosynthesis glycosyltransferase TuaG
MNEDEQTWQKGLVSIVTPVYKAERYIEETIRSVQAQTYRDWELLLVDDCSPDHSREIIERLAADDDRIRYYRLEQNSGAAVARNTAIGKARGQYLAFLDSDDHWEPEKLDRQTHFMQQKGCAFSYTRIRMTDSEGRTTKDNISVPERISYSGLLRQTVIATSTVMIDRRLTGNFSMPLRRGGQDYATWLQILRRTGYAYGINESLTVYRTSNDSLSSNKLDSVRQVYQIQTHDEHISRPLAAFNTLCFCLYAFKKHYM